MPAPPPLANIDPVWWRGLQLYNGAARDSAALYAQKVFAERARLERVMRGTFITALDSQGG
jgi:hypothetical protein